MSEQKVSEQQMKAEDQGVKFTDLSQQLQKNITCMDQNDFGDCRRLFDLVQEKPKENWSAEEIGIAIEWLRKLDFNWELAKKVKEIRELLFVAFQKPEATDSVEFINSFLVGFQNLFQKLYVLANTIAEIQKGLVYMPNPIGQSTQISQYEEIGLKLYEDSQSHRPSNRFYPATLREICEVASKIYLKIEESKITIAPSFVICASSGTGKTQIPFALRIPLIYCSLESSTQDIYRDLRLFSQYLVRLLELDFNLYVENLSLDTTRRFQMVYYSATKIAGCGVFFKTTGFLRQFIPLLLEMEVENQNSSWPRLQMEISQQINPVAISPKTAWEEIKRMASERHSEHSKSSSLNHKPLLPLVFLDEFNFTENSPPEQKCRLAFYRNLIRACGLIPVLMGTNSSIANLITSGSGTGNTALPWTHVFYKLPPYPKSLLREKLQELIPSASKSESRLFNLLLHLLGNERPLFVQHVLQEISSVDRENLKEENWMRLFQMIITRIRHEFFTRKANQLNIYPSMQTHFLEFSFSTMRSLKKPKSYRFCIHAHLAHLVPPPNCLNFALDNDEKTLQAKNHTFFDLYHVGSKPVYQSGSVKKFSEKDYKPNCQFDIFYKNPLSSIALLQKKTFKTESSNLTAFETILGIKKIAKNSSKSNEAGKPLDGRALEEIVNLAFAYASHQGGFSGQSFRKWLPHFVGQLACAKVGSSLSNPKPIEIGDEFLFAENHFPIVAFNSSQWNQNLRQFLSSKGIALGIFTGDFKKHTDLVASFCSQKSFLNPNSAKAKRIGQSFPYRGFVDQKGQVADATKTYIFIECKFYYQAIGRSRTEKFIGHMLGKNYSCAINIIVGHKFSFAQKKGQTAEKEGENPAQEAVGEITKVYPKLKGSKILVFHLKNKLLPAKRKYPEEEEEGEEEDDDEDSSDEEEDSSDDEDYDDENSSDENSNDENSSNENSSDEDYNDENVSDEDYNDENSSNEDSDTGDEEKGSDDSEEEDDGLKENDVFHNLSTKCSYFDDTSSLYLDLIYKENGATKVFILVDLAEIHGPHLKEDELDYFT